MSKPRRMEQNRKQRRKQKLAYLRERYTAAKNKEKRDKILEKVFRVAPTVTKEQFLASVKEDK